MDAFNSLGPCFGKRTSLVQLRQMLGKTKHLINIKKSGLLMRKYQSKIKDCGKKAPKKYLCPTIISAYNMGIHSKTMVYILLHAKRIMFILASDGGSIL